MNNFKIIKTFEELVALAELANDKRLSRGQYSRINIPLLKKIHVRLHRNKKTFKSFMLNVPFALRIYDYLNCRKMYSSAVHYSELVTIDFLSNIEDYKQSFELMSDEKSKYMFLNLIAGEIILDMRYGVPFQEPEGRKHSYYCVNISDAEGNVKPFINNDEILVDCGAYRGGILRELSNNRIVIQKYFGFEPTQENFVHAQQALAASGVEGWIKNVGVYNTSKTLHFTIGNNTATSHIDESGNTSIRVEKIDDLIKERVTLIKYDVEGSEYEALEGAAQLISSWKPKLAVSIYHEHTDFRKLPLLIKQINSNYSRFYIRYPSDMFNPNGFAEVLLLVE